MTTKYVELNSLLQKAKSLQNKLFAVPLILDAIEYAPVADVVSREVFEQFKWERDTALQTLKEHGIGLGGISDVVEVVRCKDCEMSRETEDKRYLFCMQFADTVGFRAFCSYGQRKEGAD